MLYQAHIDFVLESTITTVPTGLLCTCVPLNIEELFEGDLTDYESDSESLPHLLMGPAWRDRTMLNIIDTGNQIIESGCAPVTDEGSVKYPSTSSSAPLAASDKKWDQAKYNKMRKSTHQAKEHLKAKDSVKKVVKKWQAQVAKGAQTIDFNASLDAAVTKPAWVGRGKLSKQLEQRLCTKEELPCDEGWKMVHNGAMAALDALVAQMPDKGKEGTHQCGTFPIITHGISFEGISQRCLTVSGNPSFYSPSLLDTEYKRVELYTVEEREKSLFFCVFSEAAYFYITMVEKLMKNLEIQRICNFASTYRQLLEVFKSYGKKNFLYMETTMEQLRQKADKEAEQNKQLGDKLKLRRPYDGKIGVFPC
ncbi:hypothetical protein EDB85DRAFT_1891175 [Lactarius pseudohatsudake]|nr:hypothetical protein EDB85DRAFT_1891175 [Lactarius pseudohatsudake]